MLFKLYKNVFREPPPPERRKLFSHLYEKYGVELIGVWKNKENPLEYFMLTKYRDEDHFQDFIKTVKTIPEYIEMTKIVSERRISNEAYTLISE